MHIVIPGINYNAKAGDYVTLEDAIYTMRKMRATQITAHGPPHKPKGRESAMVTAFSKEGKCQSFPERGHWATYCYNRKR